MYDNRTVYGYDTDMQRSDLGSLGEELFTWMDNDINGCCVNNLCRLDDGMILSILVDTFISKISFPMQPGPEIGSISDA